MIKHYQNYKIEITNMMLLENVILYFKSMLEPPNTSVDLLKSRYLRAKISIKLLHGQCHEALDTDIGIKSKKLLEYVDHNLTSSRSKLSEKEVHDYIEILQNLKVIIKT